MKYLKCMFSIGHLSVTKIMTIFFYLGTLIIAYISFKLSRIYYYAYRTVEYSPKISNGRLTSDAIYHHHLWYGILIFIIFFLILTLVWKLLCELTAIFFKYFESKAR